MPESFQECLWWCRGSQSFVVLHKWWILSEIRTWTFWHPFFHISPPNFSLKLSPFLASTFLQKRCIKRKNAHLLYFIHLVNKKIYWNGKFYWNGICELNGIIYHELCIYTFSYQVLINLVLFSLSTFITASCQNLKTGVLS